MLFLVCFTIVLKLTKKTSVRTFFYLFSHPQFLLYMIYLISVTFYTKPDKTTKEPGSPKRFIKLFDVDIVVCEKELTLWLTSSRLSVEVKTSSIFCLRAA